MGVNLSAMIRVFAVAFGSIFADRSLALLFGSLLLELLRLIWRFRHLLLLSVRAMVIGKVSVWFLSPVFTHEGS